MAKTKEQVKYNPRLSQSRRFSKATRALAPANIVLTIILCVLALLMAGVLAVDMFVTGDILKDSKSVETIGTFAFSSMFMLLFMFGVNTTLPANFMSKNTEKQQQALMKGCVYYHEVFAHMPVKKVTLYKQSFNWYVLFMLGSSIPVLALSIAHIADSKFESAAPMVTVTAILEAVLMIVFYLGYFGIFNKKKKLMQSILTTGIVIFYIIWLGCMFGFLKFITEIEALGAIAGVPTLCITLAAIAAIIVIEKCFIEKDAEKSPWEFYTKETA